MQLPTLLIWCITAVTGLVGVVFLLLPDRIRQLERRLNAPWGDRELLSLRLGLRREHAVEQIMNRNILDKEVIWDSWSRQHPRLVGAVLCVIAAWLGWQL